MKDLGSASFASLFGLLICAVPAVVGVWYALRPSERGLAMMRPLTMAAVFSALCGFVLALANGFKTLGASTDLGGNSASVAAVVVTEGLTPVVVSLALMAVAWACVAVGIRRS